MIQTAQKKSARYGSRPKNKPVSNNQNVPKGGINWFPGHMAKTERMIAENLKLIDAVIEICDARIPYSSRNPMLRELMGSKPRVLLLNKADLADEKETAKWAAHYKEQGICAIPTDSKTGRGVSEILPAARKAAADLLAHREAKGMRTENLRLMVVGIPNVGKSTLINRLAGTKCAKTEDRPGVTRGKQWVHLSDGSELLDMPGILWPKFEDHQVGYHLAFTGAIRDQILDIEELAMLLLELLSKRARPALEERYRLTEEDFETDCYDLLESVGRHRGMLLSGGKVHMERAAAMVLDEFRSSKLGRITLETAEDYGEREASV